MRVVQALCSDKDFEVRKAAAALLAEGEARSGFLEGVSFAVPQMGFRTEKPFRGCLF